MLIKNFNSLYTAYYKKMVLFAFGYVKDNSIAEDFASEAFSIYWQNQVNLKKDTIPQSYILTIVKNKCLNYLQHLKVRKNAEDNLSKHNAWSINLSIQTLDACDPNVLFSREINDIVKDALCKMPEKTREIYLMSREGGLTYKEIAYDMELSVKSIEFHMSKALDRLRSALKDYIVLFPFILFIL